MLPTDHINTSPNYSRDAATNRLLLNGTDYTYDAAGQLVGAPAITGYHSLWYTAEGYLRSIDNYNTGSYLYNALGERTLSNHGSSGGWDLYVYLNSQPMADYDNTGTWTDNIYANGQKIARVANDPVNGVSTKYYLADQLGTTQMELDATGNVLWQGAFTPFGQEIINGVAPTYIGTQPADGTSNRYKFTGKERDTESGLDYFAARYYASGMGRWTTPDWAAKAEPVPYAKLGEPQSLNLYSYVGNNPLAQVDLDGHETVTNGVGATFNCNPTCTYVGPGSPQAANGGLPSSGTQQPSHAEQVREKIAASAEANNPNKSYSFDSKKDDFGCQTNKCNKFVHDMAASGGIAPMVKANDGTLRPARAGELANPKLIIDHWKVVTDPARGDIAAFAMSGGGAAYSGHTAIVTGVSPSGTVSAIAAHGYGVGPEYNMTSTPTHPVTYRRYVESK